MAYFAGQPVQIVSGTHGGWTSGKVANVGQDGAVLVQYQGNKNKVVPKSCQMSHLRPEQFGGPGHMGQGDPILGLTYTGVPMGQGRPDMHGMQGMPGMQGVPGMVPGVPPRTSPRGPPVPLPMGDALNGSRRFPGMGMGMCPGRPPMGGGHPCMAGPRSPGRHYMYEVGDEVMIFSDSNGGWTPGHVVHVEPNGAVMVKYENNQKMVPVQHQSTHLQPRSDGGQRGSAPRGPCAPGGGGRPPRASGPGAALYGIGDEVMIFSSSNQRWVQGRVTKIDNFGAVMVKYDREQKLVPVEYQETHLKPAQPMGPPGQGQGQGQGQSFVDPRAGHSWQDPHEPHMGVPPTDFGQMGVPPTDFGHMESPGGHANHAPTDFQHVDDYDQRGMPTDFNNNYGY